MCVLVRLNHADLVRVNGHDGAAMSSLPAVDGNGDRRGPFLTAMNAVCVTFRSGCEETPTGLSGALNVALGALW